MIGLILQARMSSRRLPGKVLSQINGVPLIKYVVAQCQKAHTEGPTIVCTSIESDDTPVYEYCRDNGILVYRGSLNDVYDRFLHCIDEFQLSAFGRVCCDSPGISSVLISLALNEFNSRPTVDLVSNVCQRTFPVGQSVEIVKSDTFCSASYKQKKGFSKEHITQTFYYNPEDYKILNIRNLIPMNSESWAVDEPGDLERVSSMIKQGYMMDTDAVILEEWLHK
jgi:spore coat polysaccharide biosynthesis protein SpsF